MKIEPSQIIPGIAHADRESICTLLALYEEAYLQKIIVDLAKDSGRWISRKANKASNSSWSECREAFEKRLDKKRMVLFKEDCNDDALRLRLWMHLREGFGLKPQMTFSRRGLDDISNDIAEQSKILFAKTLDDEAAKKTGFFTEEYWKKYARYRLNPFSRHRLNNPSFPEVVQMNVLRLIASAAERGDIPDDLQNELVTKIKTTVSKLDSEAQKELLDQLGVDELSDSAALKLLISSGSLIGFGIAVELAGFSAYILAAKASAIIPLVGGKTLVCTMAVLADPFLIIPVVLFGGVFIAGNLKKKLSGAFGVAIASILTIKAIAENNLNPDPMLDVFRDFHQHVPSRILDKAQNRINRKKQPSDFFSKENMLNIGDKTLSKIKKGFISESYPNAAGYLEKYRQLSAQD